MGGFLGRFGFDFDDADINMEGSAWASNLWLKMSAVVRL